MPPHPPISTAHASATTYFRLPKSRLVIKGYVQFRVPVRIESRALGRAHGFVVSRQIYVNGVSTAPTKDFHPLPPECDRPPNLLRAVTYDSPCMQNAANGRWPASEAQATERSLGKAEGKAWCGWSCDRQALTLAENRPLNGWEQANHHPVVAFFLVWIRAMIANARSAIFLSSTRSMLCKTRYKLWTNMKKLLMTYVLHLAHARITVYHWRFRPCPAQHAFCARRLPDTTPSLPSLSVTCCVIQ